MKKIILLIVLIVSCTFITGCTRTITYETFKKNISDKKDMIVEVVQNGCSHCQAFEPVFSKFMDDNNLEYVQLNLTNIPESDYEDLSTKFGVTGTPTVLIFKKGKELSEYRISGDQPRSVLEQTFKSAGYIK